MKKALSLILVAGLALAGVPAGAQGFGPTPSGATRPRARRTAVNAVLLDATGKIVATVPVVDGKFAFRDVAAGPVHRASSRTPPGQELARSLPVTIASGAEAGGPVRRRPAPPAAAARRRRRAASAPPPGSSSARRRSGITTAIVIAANDDETDVASPSR